MINKTLNISQIKNYNAIIWDFDGVIKDSVEIKGDIFRDLFLDQDFSVQEKIVKHHHNNGGISRVQKLKIYLDWSNHESSNSKIKNYASEFGKLVFEKVINSEYIPGILDYLKTNYTRQQFFLVTGTPEDEIIKITKKLKIYNYFRKIIGYPKKKQDAFEYIIKKYNLDLGNVIVIGDSYSEYNAAKNLGLKFILKIDEKKSKIPKWYIERDLIIKDFSGE